MKSKHPSSVSFSITVTLLVMGSAVATETRSPGQIQSTPLNPEFVAWRQRVAKDGIRLLGEAPVSGGFTPSPVDRSHLKAAQRVSAPAPLPGSYDLRTYQHVTPVKNQGACGCCWAFATYGSLESWLLKNEGELYDFSENHLKSYAGFDKTPCGGGNSDMSTAYLVRWDGPLAESDDSFQDSNDLSSGQGEICKEVLSVLWFVDANDIKNAIMTYGALFASMRWDSDRYDRDTNTYYYDGNEVQNHGVTIAGWDDTKSVPGAPRRGAWLIKNSWGTDIGAGGYSYVSYDDTKFARDKNALRAVAFCDAVPTSTYATNYYYDPLGLCGAIGYPEQDYAWGANVFFAVANEDLAAVGFYVQTENTAYEITIYGMMESQADWVWFSEPVGDTTSGVARYSGYHTIPLTAPVAVREGDGFVIAVKLTTPGHNAPVPVEMPVEGYSSQAVANPGESYISGDGMWFQDITAFPGYEQTSICIRGLTVAPQAGE